MKLVIFGLTVSSSWGNGHATLWRGLCRALARRGHTVVFYERDVDYYADEPRPDRAAGWAARPLPRLGRSGTSGGARSARRGCRHRHLLLPGRHRGVRPRARLQRTGARLLRPRHAGDAGGAQGRRGGRLHRPARPARLRPRAELHGRLGAGRAAARARRQACGAAVRQRRPGRTTGRPSRWSASAPTSRTSAPIAADRQAALEELFIEPARLQAGGPLRDRRRLLPERLPLDREPLLRPPPAAARAPGLLQLVPADAERDPRRDGGAWATAPRAGCSRRRPAARPDRQRRVGGPGQLLHAGQRDPARPRRRRRAALPSTSATPSCSRIAAAARERTLAEHTADQRAAELESLLQGAMRGLPAVAARPANAARAGVA